MTTRPIIGLEAIHRRYFVSEEGEQLISLSTLRKLSKEMQISGAVLKFESMKNGQKKVRIVALEPFFSLWMLRKWGKKKKEYEISTLVAEHPLNPRGG